MYNRENLRYEPFFSKFNTSKKNVLLVITTLTEYEIELLAKKYGFNLSNTTINKDLTDKENNNINENIIRKIKRRIEALKKGTHIIIKFTDILPDKINIDDVLNSFKNNRSYMTNRFTNLFGEDLKRRAFIKKEYKYELEKSLNEYIVKNVFSMKNRHSEFISLINIFTQYKLENETDEEILERTKKIIEEHCDSKEISLLQRKYGTDYQNTTNYGQFTFEENLIINHEIISKIKYYMKKEKRGIAYCKPLMDRLDNTRSEEEKMEAILCENSQVLEVLKKKFQDDFKGVTPTYYMTSEESKIIHQAILRINRRLDKKNNFPYCNPLIASFDKLTTIKEVIEEINEEDYTIQALFKKKYQNNYLGVSRIDSVTSEEDAIIRFRICNIAERLNYKRIKTSGISINSLFKIKEILESEEYLNLLKNIGEREALAVLTIKYMSLELSLDSLSILTGLDKMYIIELTKEYLRKSPKLTKNIN